MKKIINDGIIVAVSTMYGDEITEAEYNSIISIINNKPLPEIGYDYRLRADTLEWELYEFQPFPLVEEDATAEDYENALRRFGV